MPIRFRAIFALPLVFLFSNAPLFAQFDPPKTVLNTAFPYYGMALNDWDKDGDPDFILYKVSTKQLDWMENIGGGRLAQPAMLTDKLAAQAMPLQIADFDGDGQQDFLEKTTVSGQTAMTLNRNLGNGNFSPQVIWQDTANNVTNFEVSPRDLDGDGDLDIAFLMRNPAVIWSLGGGQFSGQTVFGGDLVVLANWKMLRAFDLENDGDLDLLAVRDSTNSSTFYVATNLGNGSFGPAQEVGPAEPLSDLYLRDSDNDGLDDLVFPTYGGLWWMRNGGNGVFETKQNLIAKPNLARAVFTDWDGDGLTDVFCLQGQVPSSSYLFRQESPGVYVEHPVLNPYFHPSSPSALADLDDDGRPELYALNAGNALVRFDNLGGVAPYASSNHWLYPPVNLLDDVSSGDLDGDNLPDLVLASFSLEMAWLKNVGNNEFAPPKVIDGVPVNTGYAENAETADFNGDGKLDIAIFSNPSGGQSGNVAIHFNDGSGNFSPNAATVPTSGDPQIFRGFRIGDLDGDGDPDIMGESLLNTGTGYLIWFKNDGAGHFDNYVTAVPNLFFSGSGQVNFELADLDGDTGLDIVFITLAGISMAFNDGTGNFSAPFSPPGLTVNDDKPLVGDLDGDGDTDLTGTSLFYWSENLGNGSFVAFKPTIANKAVVLTSRLADLDGDGDADYSASFEDGSFGWMRNLGGGQFADPVVLGTGNPAFTILPADFDGDGDLEILAHNGTTAKIFSNQNSAAPIHGRCFWDKNENGLRDTGEPPLPSIAVKIGPDDALTKPDNQGEFRFFLYPGDHELGFLPHGCWELTSDSAVFKVPIPAAAGNWFEFGFRQKSQDVKMGAGITSDPTVCGHSAQFWGIVQNTGCQPVSGVFHLFPDSRMTFNSAAVAPTVNTTTELAWPFDTLWPGQMAMFPTIFDLFNGMAGDVLLVTSIAETAAGGPAFADTAHYSPKILCSYDPNDKAVDRAEVKQGYLPETGELAYTVRFQNTGNFKAFDVRVRDVLDPKLDWETFRPIAASHAFYPVLDLKTGALDFVFHDINLPDSAANEIKSHGFVQFAVRLKPGLPKSTVVPNSASIFFDQNAAVLTNSVETKVVGPSATGEPLLDKSQLKLWPNPAKTQVEVRWETPLPGSGALLELVNLSGQVVLRKPLGAGETRALLAVGELPSEVYFLKIGGLANVLVLLGN